MPLRYMETLDEISTPARQDIPGQYRLFIVIMSINGAASSNMYGNLKLSSVELYKTYRATDSTAL